MSTEKLPEIPEWALKASLELWERVYTEEGYGCEEFVTEGYGFHDDMTHAFARALVETHNKAHETGWNDACEAAAKSTVSELSSLMAGNYTVLVDSYKSQLSQVIRKLKKRGGG